MHSIDAAYYDRYYTLRVCLSVCLSVCVSVYVLDTRMCPAKTTESIEMPFGGTDSYESP